MEFIRFCRRNRLPTPTLQTVRTDAAGRRRYLDATLHGRNGRTIHVEVDGALHLVVETYWNDMARGNELVIGRERVLRFPSYVIHANDQGAADQLRRALGLSERDPAIAG
jgi:very-short-patch-repair endonuclease